MPFTGQAGTANSQPGFIWAGDALSNASTVATAITAISSIPTPALSVSGIVTATRVPGTTTINTAVVNTGETSHPVVIVASASFGVPVPSTGETVAAAAVVATTSIAVPVASTGETVAATHAPATVSFGAVVVTTGETAAATAVTATASIPVPGLSTSVTVSATVVAAASSFAATFGAVQLYTQDFQNVGATSGANVTTALLQTVNDGNISFGAVTVDSLGTTFTYSSATPTLAQPAGVGPLYGVLRVFNSGSVFGWINYTLPYTCVTIAVTQYFSIATSLTATTHLFLFRTAANGAVASLTIGADGKLRLIDDGGATVATGAVTLTADTRYRVEISITKISTTAGSAVVSVYAGDSVTPLDTLNTTTANFGITAIGQVRVGDGSGGSGLNTTYRMGYHSIAPSAVELIGPYRTRAWARGQSSAATSTGTATITQASFTTAPNGQDLLVAFVAIDDENVLSQPPAPTTPAGWVLQKAAQGGSSAYYAVYTKVAGGPAGSPTTDGSYVWTLNTSGLATSASGVTIIAVANASTTNPLDAVVVSSNGSGATQQTPLIDPYVGNGSLLLAGWLSYQAGTTLTGSYTPPPGMTALANYSKAGSVSAGILTASAHVGLAFAGPMPGQTPAAAPTDSWLSLALAVAAGLPVQTAIAATTSFGAPVVTTGDTVIPTALAAATSFGAAAISAGSTVTATAITASTTIATPTFHSDANVTATRVPGTASFGAPAVSTAETATASAITATSSLPAPTVQTGSTVSASAVLGTTTIPVPATHTGEAATPTAIAAVTSIPTPSVSVGSSANVAATTIAATSSLPVPITHVSSTVTVSVITGTTTIFAGTTATGETVTPLVIAATSSLPGAVVHVGSTITSVAVGVASHLFSPGISTGATVTAVVVAGTTSVPTPSGSSGDDSTPIVINAHVSISVPAFSSSTVTNPTVIGGSTTIYLPDLFIAAQPVTLVVTGTVPTPVAHAGVTIMVITVNGSTVVYSTGMVHVPATPIRVRSRQGVDVTSAPYGVDVTSARLGDTFAEGSLV